MTKKILSFLTGVFFTALNAASPQVDFNGYLDADDGLILQANTM